MIPFLQVRRLDCGRAIRPVIRLEPALRLRLIPGLRLRPPKAARGAPAERLVLVARLRRPPDRLPDRRLPLERSPSVLARICIKSSASSIDYCNNSSYEEEF